MHVPGPPYCLYVPPHHVRAATDGEGKTALSQPFLAQSTDSPAKVPKNAQAEVKADYWAIFDVPEKIEPGLDAVGYVQKRIDAFEKRWRDSYPAAVR